MMGKRKFIIDLDSTICNSVEAYYRVYRDIYKNNPKFKEADYITNQRWDLTDICPLQKNAEEIFGDIRFFNHLRLYPFAYQELLKLNEEYDLTICSVGTYNNIKYKSHYISESLPFIKSSILLVNDGCKMDKSIVNIPLDAFVLDDNGDCLDSYINHINYKLCFGDKKPWNQNYIENFPDNHIPEWKGAFDRIKAIEIRNVSFANNTFKRR
jgi:5'(3')-deoxyribonucleotidase